MIDLNNNDLIREIYSVINGEKRECKISGDKYLCDVEDGYERIEYVSDNEIDNFKYLVLSKERDVYYLVRIVDDKDGYLNFYLNLRKSVLLKDASFNVRTCLNGICDLNDFEENYLYVALGNGDGSYFNTEIYMDYYHDDLSYYNSIKNDLYASSKSLTYSGSSLNVKYTRDSNSLYDQIVVLPVTYSEEWVIEENENFELVRVNGSYLGVIVKNGVSEINLTIKFEPSGVTIGVIGSIIGLSIYGGYCCYLFVKYKKKKEIIDRGNEK